LRRKKAGEDWNLLSDYEQANVKKTISEIGTAVVMYATAVVLKGLGDDEEDPNVQTVYYLTAFYARRLQAELITFLNPAEFSKTLKSPSASMIMIDRILHFIHQLLTNPFEEYESGRREGTLKLRKDIEDLVPLIKNVNRNVEEALTWMFSPRLY
jgi:hypothetical protein